MMKVIEEKQFGDTYYHIISDSNEYNIHCKSAIINHNNKEYFLLFDNNYKLISNVFTFINVYLDSSFKTASTKEKTLYALKFLYSFLAIFNIPLKSMTKNEASQFLSFLFGVSIKGGAVTMEFGEVKSASSVNGYLSAIRTYIEYMGYKKHPLLERGGRKKILQTVVLQNGETIGNHTNGYEGYKLSPKSLQKRYVPKYIHLDEYKRMFNYCRSNGDLRMECIIALMYTAGLRAGEVLAITFEDIKPVYINGKVHYKIIIRKRYGLSHCKGGKGLMDIIDRKQYNTSDYRLNGYGCSHVYVSKDLYDLLMDYIETAHSEQMNKHYNNWLTHTVTDSVDDDFNEDHNFYVFINSKGTPYSSKSLELDIKKLYIACEIPLNKSGGKNDGLCHRFRHGYAMFWAEHEGKDIHVVQKLMRHNSISSTAIYYNPDETKITEYKDEIAKTIYDFIPKFDLKNGDEKDE